MPGEGNRPSRADLLDLFLAQSKYEALILQDAEGRVVGWHAGAEHLFGYSAQEMMSQPLSRLFTPEDRKLKAPEHEMELAAKNRKSEDDRWHVRKDGSRFWASGILISLRDEREQVVGFAKVVRDRTEIKAELAGLRQQAESLKREVERKNEFLAVFGHEIGNHIAPLRIIIKLLQTSDVEFPHNLMEMLEQAEDGVDATLRLLKSLMDAARVGGGRFQLHREEVVLNEVIGKAVDTCRPQAEQRRQKLSLFPPEATLHLHADPVRLHQVFVNLIGNAVKYTPERGRVWVKIHVEELNAIIRIEDDGVGIPPEKASEIFEMFTQQEASPIDASEGGLGVGLWLVKTLVTLHGGSVGVRSEGKNKGSEFYVKLPLDEVRPTRA